MRILILNWQDIRNPLAGGAEVHLHEIFSRIAGMGHEVTLFCSSFPGAPATETIGGIRVIRRGGRYLFNFRAIWTYLTQFRKMGFDVVVDDMNKIPFFTPLYVKVPLAFVTHHMFGRSIFLETVWPLAAYVYLMEKAGFGLARKRRLPFIVGSPSACQELMDEGFDRSSVTVVNYCVDHDVHHPTGVERSRAPLIGYFGRLKKYKSIEHLLEAAAVVRKDIPDLSVIIVGEGDHRPALEERARQLGLGTSVSFTGFVPEAKKVELLQKVWFTVYTSSKEGWGLTVMEANACGTCAVASDVPGLRDAVRGGETGLLYPYGDIGALAAAIRRLIDDAQMRRNFEQAAVAWARTFDWNDAARRTLGILQSVAEVPGSRHGAPATPSSPAPPRS